MDTSEIEQKMWAVLSDGLGRAVGPAHIRVDDVEEWNSMSHIGIVMELEEAFGIEIDPELIGALYSSSDAILRFLIGRVGAKS
ncbi:MAG: acyl carrier protein [Dongiaceae bacterium]